MFERSFEIGRIHVMEGSRWILVKVVLFQLRGHGHPQGDATPNFFPDSKSTIIGLSNEASFVSRYYCKISENWEKEESIIRLYVSKRGKLYLFLMDLPQMLVYLVSTAKTVNNKWAGRARLFSACSFIRQARVCVKSLYQFLRTHAFRMISRWCKS